MTMWTSNLRGWLGAGALMALPVVAACGSKGITTPSDGSRSQTYGGNVLPLPRTVSGVVRTVDGAPVPHAAVTVFWGCEGLCSYVADVTADDAGRYTKTLSPYEDVAIRTIVWVAANVDGYLQPCAAVTPTSTGDASVDVWLVPEASPAVSVPRSVEGTRTVTGTVFETTPSGRAPVAGAEVEWNVAYARAATTRTDPEGRYSLCGIPEQVLPPDDFGDLFARKAGYVGNVGRVEASGDVTVDVELRRAASR
jgi:hypothetical protein